MRLTGPGVLTLSSDLTRRIDRSAGRARRLIARLMALRWWVRVTVVWALARLFSFLVVVMVARQQGPNPWSPAHPGYLDYIDGWDAGFYRQIFESGYPTVLPRGADGFVEPNRWAFLPVFPGVVKLVSGLTGIGWQVGAPLVATAASLGLCLVLYRLFADRTDEGTALTGVGLFASQAAAPILGFGYAESLGLLLVAGVLLCVSRDRYLVAIPLVVVAALTRPTAAPLALALGLLLLVRVLTLRPLPVAPTVRLAVLVLVAGLVAVVWPVVAGVVTGDPHAYIETEAAWHGDATVLPGELWARVARRLFGSLVGLGVLGVVLVGIAFAMLTEPVRRVGLVMWLWTGSYVLYLIGVVAPNGATFRYALGAFPLQLAAAMVSRSRAYRVVLVVLGLVLQVVWTAWLWHWSGTASVATSAHP